MNIFPGHCEYLEASNVLTSKYTNANRCEEFMVELWFRCISKLIIKSSHYTSPFTILRQRWYIQLFSTKSTVTEREYRKMNMKMQFVKNFQLKIKGFRMKPVIYSCSRFQPMSSWEKMVLILMLTLHWRSVYNLQFNNTMLQHPGYATDRILKDRWFIPQFSCGSR